MQPQSESTAERLLDYGTNEGTGAPHAEFSNRDSSRDGALQGSARAGCSETKQLLGSGVAPEDGGRRGDHRRWLRIALSTVCAGAMAGALLVCLLLVMPEQQRRRPLSAELSLTSWLSSAPAQSKKPREGRRPAPKDQADIVRGRLENTSRSQLFHQDWSV